MKFKLIAGGVVASAVLLVGCSGDDDNPTTTATPRASASAVATATMAASATSTAAAGAISSDSGASELRAGLTHLLEEHVYLAAAATHAALNGGDFEGAAGALDANSVDLSEAIGSVYGDDAEGAFLALWRAHIGFFVDYTQARATGNTAAADAAVAALDGYRTDFGAFLASANPNLPAQAVADELTPHVASLAAVVDAQAAKSPEQWTLLREAAAHMPHTAMVLAGGIVAQMPDDFDGKVDSGGAELRAGLTALLDEHVYLATLATSQAINGGDFEGAAGALDANSVALSEAVGSVYGDDAAGAFLALWRAHIGFFVDYTQAVAGGDKAAADEAKAALDGYRTDFGAFLASANPNFTTEAVADELIPHVDSVFAVIDAQVEKSSESWTLMREAAEHMPHTAAVLAGGIVAQMPDQFAAALSSSHAH